MTHQQFAYCALALFATITTPYAFSQDTDENQTDTEDQAVPTDPLAQARARGGDILIMKSGKIMSGVQILRSTPIMYEVELAPGMPPMEIPRRQVETVELDDIDPIADKRRKALMPKQEELLMADGKEVDPAFSEKLRKPISDTPLEFKEKDYMIVIAQLSKLASVTVKIDPTLTQLPPQARIWTIKITPKMTMLEVLQKHWATKFPIGKVVLERDQVVLKKKEANPELLQPPARPVPIIKN